MTKHFALLFLLVSLSILLGLSSNIVTSENHSPFINPTATPTPDSSANIEKLDLDRKEVVIPGPENYGCQEDCPDNMVIIVRANTVEPKNDELNIKYKVTGGNIVGQGKIVQWDLSRARPGTYKITAIISDGSQIKELTETIIVRDCQCSGDVCLSYCPTISVSRSKSSAKAGDTISFTANVSGGAQSDITYKWTISDGEIIDGQGTPSINVKTTAKMAGKNVKATVEIGGLGICDNFCPRTASETVSIRRK